MFNVVDIDSNTLLRTLPLVEASVYLDGPVINPETGEPYSTSRTLFQVRYYDEDRNFINITRRLGIIFDGVLGEWSQDEFTVIPPEYDGNKAGTYVFTGMLDLPKGVLNPGELEAKINVIVHVNPEVTPAALLEALAAQLQDYREADEVRGLLVKQLENSLKQAEHHLNKGSEEKAPQFAVKF